MNIDIQLINKQIKILSNKVKNTNNSNNSNKNKNISSKICIYDFFSINEIEICEKIKEIPYFYKEYSVIEYNFIKVGEMSEISRQIIQNIDKDLTSKTTNKEQKYLIIQDNQEKSINLSEYLFLFYTPKTFVFNILNCYSDVLNIIIKLNDNKVCFFNLSSENIFFKENGNPFLKSFNKSLLLNKLDENYISNIIPKITDYTCKPLEVYILFYLIMNNQETLSYHFIESVVAFFIDNMNVLTLFTENYRNTYKKQCIEYLKQYINQPKKQIISELLTYYETWDNYSLSIIYIHIIGNVIRTFELKDSFMNSFLNLLVKNIFPDPSKRENIKKTRQNYENLFNNFTNWGFIKEISLNKMKKLTELL